MTNTVNPKYRFAYGIAYEVDPLIGVETTIGWVTGRCRFDERVYEITDSNGNVSNHSIFDLLFYITETEVCDIRGYTKKHLQDFFKSVGVPENIFTREFTW